MDKDEVISLIRKNYSFLATEFSVSKIGIFGSIIKGTVAEGSDLDIVVEFQKPIGFKFIRLVEYLEGLLGKKVDVLTKDGIKNIRVKEVAADIERNLLYV